MDTLRERTFAKPGSVNLRCTIKNRNPLDPDRPGSATFISVPFLYVDALTASPYTQGKRSLLSLLGFDATPHHDASGSPARSAHKKVVLIPRRLHETFDVHDKSFGRDRKQAFSMWSGQGAEDVLWVGYVWILVVEGSKLLIAVPHLS